MMSNAGLIKVAVSKKNKKIYFNFLSHHSWHVAAFIYKIWYITSRMPWPSAKLTLITMLAACSMWNQQVVLYLLDQCKEIEHMLWVYKPFCLLFWIHSLPCFISVLVSPISYTEIMEVSVTIISAVCKTINI